MKKKFLFIISLISLSSVEVKSQIPSTKNDLEKVKQEILEEIRPIAKAVDKDAITIIRHERRIARLEQR